jgi:ribosome-binding protein aMBF1 (putative translation factor)
MCLVLDGAASNKQHSVDKNTAKLDRETEELSHSTVTLDVGRLIMQGRQAKGLTQKELATVSWEDIKLIFRLCISTVSPVIVREVAGISGRVPN